MKYVVDYTEKPYQGFKQKTFKNRNDAAKWLLDNTETIYWSSLRQIDPESDLPRPQVIFDPSQHGYTRIEGVLDTMYETGMEVLGLILYENGKEAWAATHFIKQDQILEYNGRRVAMVKDRGFASKDAYRLSFYPAGFTLKEWYSLFDKKTPAVLWVKK